MERSQLRADLRSAFDMEKTVITFKFLRPAGIQIDGFGNFSPHFKKVLATPETHPHIPPALGNTWVDGHDLDEEYTITLQDENVRPLPKHIDLDGDPAVRAAFMVKQAEDAERRHEANNLVRDELASYQKRGIIKVVSDSFMDKRSKNEVVEEQPQTPPNPAPPKGAPSVNQPTQSDPLE